MELKEIIKDNQLIIPDAPLCIFLDLTNRCNLKCWFCYNEDNPRKEEASYDDVINILKMIHDVSCDEVIYLGGEPTLHSKFFNILDYGEDLGIAQTVVTNGQILTYQFVKRLVKYTKLEIGVSVHSCDPYTQNKISGSRFAFKKLDNALDNLSALGVNWYSQTSLVKDNYLYLHELYQYLLTKGNPLRMDLSRMVTKNSCSEGFLNESEYIKVFDQIDSLDNKIPIRIESFPRCWLKKISKTNSFNYKKLLKTVRPCYAWIAQMSVDIKGNVRMCPTGGCLAGNILEGNIKEIWKSGAIKYFQSFNWQKKECLICPDFPYCVGGCKMTNGLIQPYSDEFIIDGGIPYACINK